MLPTCVINLQLRKTRAHSRMRVPFHHTGRDGLPFRIQTSNAVWSAFDCLWPIDALLAREWSNIGDLPVGLAVTAPQVKEPSWSVGWLVWYVYMCSATASSRPSASPLPFYALT